LQSIRHRPLVAFFVLAFGITWAVWVPRTADNPLGSIRLTPDRVRPKTNEEIEGERLAAENERSARLRWVYEAIGLAVTAHKDGTLVLRWSCGTRALPAVTGSESSVLRSIYSPDDG
jgi:hypothetical protein